MKIGPSRCVLYSFFSRYGPMCTARSVDDYVAAHLAVAHVAAGHSLPSPALDPYHESSTSKHSAPISRAMLFLMFTPTTTSRW